MSDDPPERSSGAVAPAPPRRERARCPRCGSRLGVLGVGSAANADALYCACCGLVVPDAR